MSRHLSSAFEGLREACGTELIHAQPRPSLVLPREDEGGGVVGEPSRGCGLPGPGLDESGSQRIGKSTVTTLTQQTAREKCEPGTGEIGRDVASGQV